MQNILIIASAASPHRRRKPWPHKVWLHWEQGTRIKPDHFWNPKWVELWWLATCNCQQEPESLFCMRFYHHHALHSKNKRHWQERRLTKKRKFLTDLWPPGGPKGAAPHAYRWGSNRVYDCIIFSFSSSPLHPSVDTRSHYTGADRPDITHSLAS